MKNDGYQLPQLVLFDYGGVVADHYSQPYLSQLSKLVGAPSNEILMQLSEKTPHGKAFRLASVSKEEFWNTVRSNLHVAPFPIDQAQLLWAKTYVPNEAMLKLISFLRVEVNVAVGLVLNEDEHRLAYVRKELDSVNRFNYVLASCELGALKPEVGFYERIAEICPPAKERGRVLIVDDRESHVAAPIACGFQGYHFTSPGEFSIFISNLINPSP